VYDALGHDAASLRDPVHARLLVQSIAWAAARGREGVER
jgi:type 1 glutamine amidotransferase